MNLTGQGTSMTVSYDLDVIAWANEQAALIRAGRFDMLDLEHIADEIEDVGKSEQRELAHRMSLLIAHLLKCKFQHERLGNSWMRTIKEQRVALEKCIKKTPSLKTNLLDDEWISGAWADAVAKASDESGLDCFPDSCPWSFDQILSHDFFPEAISKH
jgi:hypothetical protein